MLTQKLSISKSLPTIEGAGVRLKRAFGFHDIPRLDPFLLLDDFGSRDPQDYMAGFPWHPHRGIETVTYVLAGSIEHGDSIGNSGIIGSGDVQWMTAGSGIIHQEMPQKYDGLMRGFQLWVNLPADHKMMAPRYREVKKDLLAEVPVSKGVTVKIIAGNVGGTQGPVQDIVVQTEYLDVAVASGAEFSRQIPPGHTVFAYVVEGSGFFKGNKTAVDAEHLVVFDKGSPVSARAAGNHFRFLLVSGKPIGEPIVWGGPIVMNTQEELDTAFQELDSGSFIKRKADS